MTRKRILWLIVLSAAAWTVSPAAEQVVRYPSVDQFGKPIELSGRLTTPPDSAKGIILLLHGTYTSNDEIPSNKPMYEEKWFAQDYVLVMPDYMGYGATKDSIHPYLCGELTAQQNIDMLLFDGLVSADPVCTLPHPRLGERAFWLVPLRDIAPDLLVQGTPVGRLLEGLRWSSEGGRIWQAQP